MRSFFGVGVGVGVGVGFGQDMYNAIFDVLDPSLHQFDGQFAPQIGRNHCFCLHQLQSVFLEVDFDLVQSRDGPDRPDGRCFIGFVVGG